MRNICRRAADLRPRSSAAGTWWLSLTLLTQLAPSALLAAPAAPAAPARAAGSAAAPARRPIAETDLFRFVWIADPRISPDGKRIAFVRVTVDAKHDGYETALWIVDAEPSDGTGAGPRPLTAGPRDTAPRWSPDGRRLAFVRHAGKEDQLYLLPLDGGEARQLTNLPGGASSPAWSPDGKTLAFLSSTNVSDLAKPAAGKKAAESAPRMASDGTPTPAGAAEPADPLAEHHESDVRVINRAVYRANGAGYLDATHPDHVWTVAVPEAAADPADPAIGGEPPPKQITRGEFDEQDPVWAPDGSRLYVVSDRVKEAYYEDAGEAIYAVPAAGGELARVTGITGGISIVAVSPDGSQIAFVGAARGKPVRSYDQPDLWVAPTAPTGGASEPRNLTAAFDFDIGSHLVGDQHPPRGGSRDIPVWSADGRSLLALAEERGRVDLRRFDAGRGDSQPVTAGDHEVVSYTATPDGRRLALVISTPTAIGDLFVLDLAAAAGARGDAGPRQLTHFNQPLFAQLNLTAPEAMTYRSFDGREIEAWVQRPPDFRPGKPYPMILDIHGGPHGAHGYTFFHEVQWMAAKGYVVLYPNPRGSTAYGQEFGNVIQYRYPGDDFKDLMAGVDELVRRGDADPKRLGVTGGSGGGLLTNWTITQTDRFAAAVSQRSIADWAGWWYTADFTLFTPRWFRGAPFEDPQDFAARSPITFIKNVKTPLMLIEGEADYRTPPTSGGETMFRALKYLHRPVVMVRFPGESHELSRSGRPWHRVERLQHIVRWFDKYLKGEKIDLYDVR
jgi:dipeptidyl aminopeptidase/acylaminoacyl peptidase